MGREMLFIAEVTAAGWGLLIATIVVLVGLILSLYTRKGSGVSKHRHQSDTQPGSEGPGETAAVDQGENSPTGDQTGMK